MMSHKKFHIIINSIHNVFKYKSQLNTSLVIKTLNFKLPSIVFSIQTYQMYHLIYMPSIIYCKKNVIIDNGS